MSIFKQAFLKHLYNRWLSPVFDPIKAFKVLRNYVAYVADWQYYTRLSGSEELRFSDSYPQVCNRTTVTPFDPHYLYQAVWSMRHIVQSAPEYHIDIGSDIRFVTMLTTHLPVTFVDIRPLHIRGISQLNNLAGDLTRLPFVDEAVRSLSCLHVAEHVGLGRYGDTLTPYGTQHACTELARVLAPKGNLFFSLPVGTPRVCFNAHRVHSSEQILEYFGDLDMIEFSAVDDDGNLLIDIDSNDLKSTEYGCGLFWFRK